MVKQLTIYELLTDYSEASFKEKEEFKVPWKDEKNRRQKLEKEDIECEQVVWFCNECYHVVWVNLHLHLNHKLECLHCKLLKQDCECPWGDQFNNRIKCYICDKLPAQYGYNFWKDDKGNNVGWVGGGYCENCWNKHAQFKTKQEIEKELGWKQN